MLLRRKAIANGIQLPSRRLDFEKDLSPFPCSILFQRQQFGLQRLFLVLLLCIYQLRVFFEQRQYQ